ncbi:MAG TPA: hypothetical protein VEL47_05170 [Myxococcota bacterium]|nr:hypothetical protein [Myxococcota bacterium]
MLARCLLLGAFFCSSFVLGMDDDEKSFNKAAAENDPCKLLDQMITMDPDKSQKTNLTFVKRLTKDTNGTHTFNRDMIRLNLACSRGLKLAPGSTLENFSFVKEDQ